MLEKDFNSVVSKSFNSLKKGWGFKISDAGQYINNKVTHSKNPYDGIFYYDGHFGCWESKFLNKPSSFNLDRLEDHQIANLIKTVELVDNSISLFLVGVNFGRGDVRCYVWKNKDLYTILDRKTNKRNIFKKEFENRTNYVTISRGLLNIEEILSLPEDDYRECEK